MHIGLNFWLLFSFEYSIYIYLGFIIFCIFFFSFFYKCFFPDLFYKKRKLLDIEMVQDYKNTIENNDKY